MGSSMDVETVIHLGKGFIWLFVALWTTIGAVTLFLAIISGAVDPNMIALLLGIAVIAFLGWIISVSQFDKALGRPEPETISFSRT